MKWSANRREHPWIWRKLLNMPIHPSVKCRYLYESIISLSLLTSFEDLFEPLSSRELEVYKEIMFILLEDNELNA